MNTKVLYELKNDGSFEKHVYVLPIPSTNEKPDLSGISSENED
jgi:hypothetical protein